MKRFVVLLLAGLWALSTPLSAQAVLGFHGGVNIADLAGDDVEDTESLTGINVGASIMFSIAGNLGLQVGGSYSEKGAKVSDVEPGVDAKFSLAYIEFPVLLRYSIPSSSALGFHLFGGGAIGLESKCEVEGSDGGVTVTVDCDEAGFEVTSTDFGLMGGAGVDIGVTDRIDVMIDLLYNYGLITVDDSGEEGDVKNRAFTIRAGLAIPLG
jgi:opacity protein-like surface antigen